MTSELQPKSNTPEPPATAGYDHVPPQQRLMSIDALRGFDMFWIIGGEGLIKALPKISNNRWVAGLNIQMDHVEWQGFHFYDLIFAMFVFIVGASLVFSLSRTIEKHGRRQAVMHIFRRALLMYLLGIFYYGGFSTPFEKIRLLGVLQRIALCYFFAGLIFCYFGNVGRLLWCFALLGGYWALMTYVAPPGGVAGDFAEGKNLANWVDKEYLPLRKWDGNHDPEGLLSTLPAIGGCLIGVFAGVLLRNSRRSNWEKILYMLLAGALLAALGWTWDAQFPVIKKIWTSSFVLVASGYSLILLALFHLIIEVIGLRLWAQPFVWIGMNPITLYIIDNVFDDGIEKIAKRLVGGQLNTYFGDYGQLAIATAYVLVMFAIARFLYVRKVFLRL
jgi:predicted acyltransferase